MDYLDGSMQILEFLKRKTPLAALFYSDWCPFSIMMRTSFEAVFPHHRNVRFGKVRLDVVSRSELVLPISSIPTLLLAYNGKTIDSFVGVLNPINLSAKISTFEALLENEDRLDVSTPALGGDFKHVLVLRLPRDLTKYRAKSQLTILNLAGKELGQIELDRTLTHMLLFFDYAKRCGFEGGLFNSGRLTKKCFHVLRNMKRDIGLGSAPVHGIESSDSADDSKYLAKQVSRLNRVIREHTTNNVIDNGETGYQLLDNVKLQVTKV